MSLEDAEREILQRVLAATEDGRLEWHQEFDGWYSAAVGAHNEKALIRRMYLGADNQIGADPYFVEFSIPGWKARFAIVNDSEGWQWIRKILDAGVGDWENDTSRTIEYLNVHLPKAGNAG